MGSEALARAARRFGSASAKRPSVPLLMRTTSPSLTPALCLTRRSASCSRSVGGALTAGFTSSASLAGATGAGCDWHEASARQAAAETSGASSFFTDVGLLSGVGTGDGRTRRPGLDRARVLLRRERRERIAGSVRGARRLLFQTHVGVKA